MAALRGRGISPDSVAEHPAAVGLLDIAAKAQHPAAGGHIHMSRTSILAAVCGRGGSAAVTIKSLLVASNVLPQSLRYLLPAAARLQRHIRRRVAGDISQYFYCG